MFDPRLGRVDRRGCCALLGVPAAAVCSQAGSRDHRAARARGLRSALDQTQAGAASAPLVHGRPVVIV
jgi:hypothetical protein